MFSKTDRRSRRGRTRALVAAVGGVKSLYSDSYFTEAAFWSIFDGRAYTAVKKRYDPAGAVGDVYAKCVLRH